MKRVIPLLLLLAVGFFSCKKNDSSTHSNLQGPKPASYISEAKSYFEKEVLTSSISSGNSGPTKTPLWDQAYIRNLKGKETVVVPLHFDKNIYLESNFGGNEKSLLTNRKRLYIFRDNQGKLKSDVVTLIPDQTCLQSNSDMLSTFIKVEDWNDNVFKILQVKDNKVYSYPLQSNTARIGPVNSSVLSIGPCYYMVYWVCDMDETGLLSNCEIVNREFLGCTSEGREVPGEEDYGSSYSDDYETCSDVKNSISGYAIAGAPIINTTEENSTTRTKAYQWTFFKQNQDLWKWESIEEGKHIKTNNEWHWQSLTHKSIARSGVVIGGTVECQLNLATPTIGTYYSSMSLNYTINNSALCKGSPISSGTTSTSTCYFNVND